MSASSGGTVANGAAATSNDRIIRAALALIAEDGLGAVTMMGIAEVAGVSRQTLYNHYSDIDSIVTEAIARHDRESIELLDSSLRVVDQPESKLEQVVRHVVSIGAHSHHIPGIHHGLSADSRAVLSQYDNALVDRIRAVLEEGQISGVFRSDLAPALDARLIRRMLDGLAELAGETPERAADVAAAGIRTVLATVTVR